MSKRHIEKDTSYYTLFDNYSENSNNTNIGRRNYANSDGKKLEICSTRMEHPMNYQNILTNSKFEIGIRYSLKDSCSLRDQFCTQCIPFLEPQNELEIFNEPMQIDDFSINTRDYHRKKYNH